MNIKLLAVVLSGLLFFFQTKTFGQSCGSTGSFDITPSTGCAPLTVTTQNLIPKASSLSYVFNFDKDQTTPLLQSQITQDSSYTYTNAGTFTILQFGSSEGTGFSLCKDVVVYETRAPNAEAFTCQNGMVRLSLISDSIAKAYDQIQINWGDGSPATIWKKGDDPSLSHMYAAMNTVKLINLRGSYDGGLCQSDLQSTTITSQPPASLTDIQIINLEILVDGSANITYRGIDQISTELYMDDGNGQFVSSGRTESAGGQQTIHIRNLDPEKIYRFRMVSTDLCGDPVESDFVSSIIVKKDSSNLDEVNILSWKHFPNTINAAGYELLKDGISIFSTTDQFTYLDSDVKCGNVYSYQVVATLLDGTKSYSAPFEASPDSSPPDIIELAYVSVLDNNLIQTVVELSGQGLTSSYNLTVERSNDGFDFQRVSVEQNESLTFTDENVSTSENSYCYRFSYTNACNQSSPSFSNPVCSILLRDNINELLWTEASPFINGVASYDLVQTDIDGNIVREFPKGIGHNHSVGVDLPPDHSFMVKAKSLQGNTISNSNILRLNKAPILLIPDVFTPNGDGVNDTFEIKSYFVNSVEMLIYNRWGEVVFKSSGDSEPWDGTINGKLAPTGYYIFDILAEFGSNQNLKKRGSFLLAR